MQRVKKCGKIKRAKNEGLSKKDGILGVQRDVLPEGRESAEHRGIFSALWRQAAEGQPLGAYGRAHALGTH